MGMKVKKTAARKMAYEEGGTEVKKSHCRRRSRHVTGVHHTEPGSRATI
jgi:hypothetical protein